jgi:hypothetical protein
MILTDTNVLTLAASDIEERKLQDVFDAFGLVRRRTSRVSGVPARRESEGAVRSVARPESLRRAWPTCPTSCNSAGDFRSRLANVPMSDSDSTVRA